MDCIHMSADKPVGMFAVFSTGWSAKYNKHTMDANFKPLLQSEFGSLQTLSFICSIEILMFKCDSSEILLF